MKMAAGLDTGDIAMDGAMPLIERLADRSRYDGGRSPR